MGELSRGVAQLIGIIAFLGGGYCLYLAITTPIKFNLQLASAVQVTQVYSEATYYGVVAGVLFLLAIFVQLSLTYSATLRAKE
jgi:hypothetical protein